MIKSNSKLKMCKFQEQGKNKNRKNSKKNQNIKKMKSQILRSI